LEDEDGSEQSEMKFGGDKVSVIFIVVIGVIVIILIVFVVGCIINLTSGKKKHEEFKIEDETDSRKKQGV
jgi:flagellar basal body-associated protein FliL